MLSKVLVDLIFNSLIVLYFLISPIVVAMVMYLFSIPESVYLFVLLNIIVVLVPFLYFNRQ